MAAQAVADPASISRRESSADAAAGGPQLRHTLHVDADVISVAASSTHIFAGSPDAVIHVWRRGTFERVGELRGHAGSVGCLLVIEDDMRRWLVSSGSDSTIRLWALDTLQPVCVVQPAISGRIHSLLWDPERALLYFGSQSTFIQWVHLPDQPPSPSVTTHLALRSPEPRSSRFFDAHPPSVGSGTSTPVAPPPAQQQQQARVPTVYGEVENSVPAHWGYVYALCWVEDPKQGGLMLASGSGGGDVKIWAQDPAGALELVKTFASRSTEAVLSLASAHTTLFAGLQDGAILVFDLETRSMIRMLVGHEKPVVAVEKVGRDVYSASSDGQICRWSSSFHCTSSFLAHSPSTLALALSPPSPSPSSSAAHGHAGEDGARELFSGGSGGLCAWAAEVVGADEGCQRGCGCDKKEDVLLHMLSKLVSFPTVPSPSHREDCRQASIYLKNTLRQLGATDACLLAGAEAKNPLVLATFGAQVGAGEARRKRVLFYGHYDVVGAAVENWATPPWELTARDGYLYGRGVADNKGPVLAMALAASALLERGMLGVDLVMLIEGEEEAGSHGLQEAIERHRDKIGEIDVILASNSFWIGEERPCILYGLRGVVHLSLEVSSNKPDQHSGVEGGGIREPMVDMVRLIGSLSDEKDRVKVPAFYDRVRPIGAAEAQAYDELAVLAGRPAENLKQRFSRPSYSVAHISAGDRRGGGSSATVIPSTVNAAVSFRLVPDQDLDEITKSITDYLEASFAALDSPNQLRLEVPHRANWWLGDIHSPVHALMEDCISAVWDVPRGSVLRIREGGSIGSIPLLESALGAPCVHVPLGQSSDNGHLKNERMRLKNLLNGRAVFSKFLETLPGLQDNSG